MNEASQLKAMAAELVAAGYEVRQDVHVDGLSDLGLTLAELKDMSLDFVAARRDGHDGSKPTVLVIEVANRVRRPPAALRKGIEALPRILLDDEAVERFERIADALVDEPRAEFEIRFLDVSAEQAAARRITAPVRSAPPMATRLTEDRLLLAQSSGRDELSHTLLVARIWGYWLRVVGNRYPGRSFDEMRQVDLRTLQKDLYDHEVLRMTPMRYRSIHVHLLAIVEGGDFEPFTVSDLEPELRLLMDHVADWYGLKPFSEQARFSLSGLFGEIQRQLDAAGASTDVEDMKVALVALALQQDRPVFPQAVARFQLALAGRRIVSEDLVTRLLEEALR